MRGIAQGCTDRSCPLKFFEKTGGCRLLADSCVQGLAKCLSAREPMTSIPDSTQKFRKARFAKGCKHPGPSLVKGGHKRRSVWLSRAGQELVFQKIRNLVVWSTGMQVFKEHEGSVCRVRGENCEEQAACGHFHKTGNPAPALRSLTAGGLDTLCEPAKCSAEKRD